jgi:pimeloyl-ACP methyl ester carboxylesterase
MTPGVVLIALAASVVGIDERAPFIAFGGDGAQGVLVNLSVGARPCDPAVPGRPTVVFIHGFNPLPRAIHFTMSEQVGQALVRRVGTSFNILAWDWNAATFVSLSPRDNGASAVAQGRLLAAALWQSRLRPAQIQLIGHSSGSIVAASAARTFALEYGQTVAQLTMLEPAASYHPLVFERLAAGAFAHRVENYWSPDRGAYGSEVVDARVENIRVDRPRPPLARLAPLRSSHMYVVEWYISTISDPSYPVGFNRSLLLAARR